VGTHKKVIKIPSEISNIKKVSSEILNSLAPYKLNEDRLFDIRLCTEEAVRNAIVHGNRSDKKLYVTVNYWVDNNKLSIEIEDEGPGFDCDKVPDPTDEDNLIKGSGRGVYLVRHLMDEVEFNDKGNKVRFAKYLDNRGKGDSI